ncbi:ribosome hibernation-promoting factor, HPF/YfiA family [Vibrio owensii]|uniref:ribosome hibernation-promoting factor, HPF/YfiA family n=1 Tax=Vibrio harveyi group TaxID=717610 RepID=UPI003CC543FA
MSLTVTGHQIDVTDAIRSACEKHHQKLSEHFPCIAQTVTFTPERHEFKVHSEYKTDNGLFIATATNGDLYQALSKISDKLNRQLREAKPKH